MLNKYSKQVKLAVFAFLVLFALVLLLTASTPTKAGAPALSPAVPAYDTFTCTPYRVAAFTNRVHIWCSSPAPGGISWFAVSTSDSGSASRFLSIFTTAKVTGKNVIIFYTASDTSGNAWGCNAADCRIAQGAEVMP